MPRGVNLLFVNKNSGSKALTHSEGDERLEIFAHVQRPPSPTNQSADFGWVNLTTSTFDSVQFEEVRSNGDSNKPQEMLFKRRRKAQTDREGSRALPLNAPKSPEGTSFKPSVTTFGIADLDPFDSSVDRLDSQAADLLKFHYVHVLGPVFPPAVTSWKNEIISFTSSRCLSDRHFQSALLCFASGHIYQQTANPAHGQRFFQYRGLAISRLRENIAMIDSTPLDAGTLYGVSLLLWLDLMEGNIDDIDAHLSGLKSLVAAIWAKETPAPIVAAVTVFLNFTAAATNTAPIALPESINRERQLLKQEEAVIHKLETELLSSSSKTGNRLFAAENAEAIGQSLFHLGMERRKYLAFLPFCMRQGQRPTLEEIALSFFKNFAIDHDLLKLPYQVDPAKMMPLTPMQNTVRLALFLVSEASVTLARSNPRFCHSIASQLRTSLWQSRLSTLWSPCSDLLLWVLAMTASVSHGEDAWKWIVPLIDDLFRVLNIRSFESMEHTMSEFFMTSKLTQVLPEIWNATQTARLVPSIDDNLPRL